MEQRRGEIPWGCGGLSGGLFFGITCLPPCERHRLIVSIAAAFIRHYIEMLCMTYLYYS